MVLVMAGAPAESDAILTAFKTAPDIEFRHVSQGADAVPAAVQFHPTVVLLCLDLNHPDGLRLISEFRAHPVTRDVPIMILSASATPEARMQAFSLGANDFVAAMPDPIELVARIRCHSRAYLNQGQRDAAYRALRESQEQMIETNQQLRALNQRLEEATLAKSAFLANMSHEIRTPMNGVVGMTELLLNTELTDEQREYVESTRSSAEALITIVNDILDLTKIEAGRLELEHHPFELHSCIEEALEMLAPKATEKQLDLAYFVDDSIPKILVSDVTRLRQILVNLVSNAVKFTPQGEVCIEVRPASSATPRPKPVNGEHTPHPQQWQLHFTVRDTGIGIPRDKHDRLFKSFQQVDASTSRHYGGTGLGLAICKRLSELLGGTIWVESDAGQGATFHFTIVAKAAAALVAPNWQQAQPRFAGRRLLFIEDNPTNQRLVRHRAQQWGITTETVATADAALALLRRDSAFDVLLLDLQLKEADGFALVSQIRAQPNARTIPIALLTTKTVRNDDPRAAALGLNLFVHKPIRPAQLLDVMARALSVHIQHEKRAPAVPSLDGTLAARLPLRILLADDNPINQRVGQSVLLKLGYHAELATNGLEVIQAIERGSFDLLFLDVQMPELDGLEAARQITARWPADRRPRIIAMTGNAFLGDREKCLAAGMDDYICKPIRIAELQEAIQRWGPTKLRRTDTTMFLRKNAQHAGLLDQHMIAELREMRPPGGVSILGELIDLFDLSAPERLERIRHSIADPEQLSRQAQALKSLALNMGACRVADLSKALELMARDGKVEAAPGILAELESVLTDTRRELADLRKQPE
jgi:signal transduction histidine kinase/AmiR/NasT family two-component response regulator